MLYSLLLSAHTTAKLLICADTKRFAAFDSYAIVIVNDNALSIVTLNCLIESLLLNVFFEKLGAKHSVKAPHFASFSLKDDDCDDFDVNKTTS